jgi:hypothetical protein
MQLLAEKRLVIRDYRSSIGDSDGQSKIANHQFFLVHVLVGLGPSQNTATAGLPNGSRTPTANGETCGRPAWLGRETGHNEVARHGSVRRPATTVGDSFRIRLGAA